MNMMMMMMMMMTTSKGRSGSIGTLTYLLTPWSRVLEKLADFQLVKKFPAFYGTRIHKCPPKLEDHLLSAVRDCIFNIVAAKR